MNAETLEQIQTKISFLERSNAELSDALFQQYQLIEQLRAQLRAVSERLDAAQSEERARAPEEERPPHY